jgi:hypothetical protein
MEKKEIADHPFLKLNPRSESLGNVRTDTRLYASAATYSIDNVVKAFACLLFLGINGHVVTARQASHTRGRVFSCAATVLQLQGQLPAGHRAGTIPTKLVDLLVRFEPGP